MGLNLDKIVVAIPFSAILWGMHALLHNILPVWYPAILTIALISTLLGTIYYVMRVTVLRREGDKRNALLFSFALVLVHLLTHYAWFFNDGPYGNTTLKFAGIAVISTVWYAELFSE